MTSYEYAEKLKQQAEFLLARPEFPMPKYEDGKRGLWYMWESSKPAFLAAVKALGPGKKELTDEYVKFFPTDGPIHVYIDRKVVCKLVRPAEYDCESLLSQAEEQTLEAQHGA